MQEDTARFWVAVASREHVQRGVAGGFCQVCHGKAGPLRRLRAGDGLIYYSSKAVFGEPEPCRAFTAIGRIIGDTPYPFAMSETFAPFRRDVAFYPAVDAPIAPLIDSLDFLPDKKRWGYPFRFGILEIGEADFRRIAAAMRVAEECTP